MKIEDLAKTPERGSAQFLGETLRVLGVAEPDAEIALGPQASGEGLSSRLLVATPVGLLLATHAEFERGPQWQMTAELIGWDEVGLEVKIVTSRDAERDFLSRLDVRISVPTEARLIALEANPRLEGLDANWRSGTSEFIRACLSWKGDRQTSGVDVVTAASPRRKATTTGRPTNRAPSNRRGIADVSA